MAAAGFIPVVGWAGRAAKGGVAIYRTAKVLTAADHALDAYKTTKGFTALQKTEKGLYALAAANGMGEGITGRDFLGNKLTDEQKQQSLIQAFSILGLGAASKFIGGKPANIPFNTYSKQYAQATAKNAQNTLREIGKQIGKVDVPVSAKVLKMAGNGPIQPKVLAIETKTLSEVKQGLGEKLAKKKEQKQVNKELSGGSEGTGKIKFKNIGEYFNHINDIAKRGDLTNEEKFEKIHQAYDELEVKGDVTIVSDMQFLKHDGFVDGRMNIDWPDKMGFEEGYIQMINRNNPLPEKWDRVGGKGGENFTTLPNKGVPYTYDQRAIPYLENPSARHVGIFKNESYFRAIDAIKSENLEELNRVVVANGKMPSQKLILIGLRQVITIIKIE